MKLEGKVAIITGSSRGIGYQIAKSFLENGAKVVICGSKEENALKAVDNLQKEMNLKEDYRLLPMFLY